MNPEAVLSTAPASPTEELPPSKRFQHDMSAIPQASSTTMPPQHSTVARMSYGPAIEQTITTVTTTKTVSLEPLVMNPPKDLNERDPKQYPLAFTPTPGYLKRFCVDVHGRPIHFHEEEDAQRAVRNHQQQQADIEKHNGSIRSETKQDEFNTPPRKYRPVKSSKNVHNVRASNAPKRTATPPSIAEAAELASLHRKTKKPRSQLERSQAEDLEYPSLNQRTAAGEIPNLANPSPVTPDTDVGLKSARPPKAGSSMHPHKRRHSATRPQHSRLRELQFSEEDKENSPDLELDEPLAPALRADASSVDASMQDDSTMSGDSQPDVTGETPPAGDIDLLSEHVPQSSRRRPALNILTSSQQDASLPSPIPSPTTAAANPQPNPFDAAPAVAVPDSSSGDLNLIQDGTSYAPRMPYTTSHSFTNQDQLQVQPNHAMAAPTIMDIPTMVDAFDAMPEEMQSYVMYQLLRRCAKPTLQMVANVVNPALKCDPFSVLPVELGLNIIRYLDVQSMCRAAQVSKRWRRNINSDETAWRDLLKRDSFVLPEGEIARAVKQGWGWQHPGSEGFEDDLARRDREQTPEYAPVAPVGGTVVSDDEETTSTSTTTSKRKSLTKTSGTQKKMRRRLAQTEASATKPSGSKVSNRIDRLVKNSKGGPNALAQVATLAVPNPTIGVPSLKNMHLFKSLYQRHYLIRKSWMTEESQPQHLAFRAHHRHVVTCLLFDGEKILTGSDDTKINVYDTKKGALKTRLEGHEGGVWALQYEGNTLVSGSTDRSVRVWDIEAGRCLHVFQGHTSTVRCLVILKPVQIGTEADGTPIIMPKEPLIITGSRDSTLRVWKLPQPGDRSVFQVGPPANDRDNPYFLRTLSGHGNSVRAIAAHGDTLISGSYDHTVRVWKISNGDLLHRLVGHTQKVYSVVLDHARNRCISGSMDNLVKIWDLQTGSCLFNLEGHTSLVGLLDLSHDRLVSAAADTTLRIWDPVTGTCKSTLSAHTGAITCFQHDGQKVISGSDRTLKMWNVRNGECVRDLLTDLSGVWQVRFDERRCVAAVQRNNLTYIEVRNNILELS
jgi:F-box and WD-40 domain protein CDC4